MASLQHLPSFMWQFENFERLLKASARADQGRLALVNGNGNGGGNPNAMFSFPNVAAAAAAAAAGMPAGLKPMPDSAASAFGGLLVPAAPHSHKCSPLPSPNAAAAAAGAFNPVAAMLLSFLQQQAIAAEQSEANHQAPTAFSAAQLIAPTKEAPKWPFVWSPASATGTVSPFVDHATTPHDSVNANNSNSGNGNSNSNGSCNLLTGGMFSCPVCGCKVNHSALADHFREELEMLEAHFTSLKKLRETKTVTAAANEPLSLSLPKMVQGFDAACSTALSEKRYQAYQHVRSNRQRRGANKSHRKRQHDSTPRDAGVSAGANAAASSSPAHSHATSKFVRLSESADQLNSANSEKQVSPAPEMTPGASGSESGEVEKDATDYIDVVV